VAKQIISRNIAVAMFALLNKRKNHSSSQHCVVT